MYHRPLRRRQAKRSWKGWHTFFVVQKIPFLNDKERVARDVNTHLEHFALNVTLGGWRAGKPPKRRRHKSFGCLREFWEVKKVTSGTRRGQATKALLALDLLLEHSCTSGDRPRTGQTHRLVSTEGALHSQQRPRPSGGLSWQDWSCFSSDSRKKISRWRQRASQRKILFSIKKR